MNARINTGIMTMMMAGLVLASPVDFERAAAAARTFVTLRYPAAATARVQTVSSLGTSACGIGQVEQLVWSNTTVGFVVHLQPVGYVLLRANDTVFPVKMHSDRVNFARLPEKFTQIIRQELAAELDAVAQPDTKAPSPYTAEWAALVKPDGDVPVLSNYRLTEALIGPLLETEWEGDSPYNAYAPGASGGSGGRADAGANAVSLAQIIRHHQRPSAFIGAECQYTDSNGSCTGLRKASTAGLTPYDWSNMPAMISAGSPEVERLNVAKLIYHCGVILNMDYEAWGSEANINSAPLRTYFQYTCLAPQVRGTQTDQERYQKFYTDIYNNRPVWYQFRTWEGAVCDGVDNNGPQIHLVNDGWPSWYYLAGESTNNMAIFEINPPGGAVPLLPTAPVSISASDTQYVDMVELTWPGCERAARYAVFRNTTNDVDSATNLVNDITERSYNDYTMEIGPEYYYWVCAGNARGWTALSPSDVGSAMLYVPAKPTLAASDGVPTNKVVVTWPPVARAASNLVLRSTTSNITDATVLADNVDTNWYEDVTAVTEMTYWYWLFASNMTGVGEVSDPDIGYCADPVLQPDLVIEDVMYAPGVFTTGDLLTISYTERNLGPAAVPAPRPISTRAMIRQQSGAQLILTSMTSSAGCAVGESNRVTCVYRIPGTAVRGAYSLKIEADFGQNVAETNEDNNVGFTGSDDIIIAVLNPKDNARINSRGLVFINSSKSTNWWLADTNTVVAGERWLWTIITGLGPKDTLKLSGGKKIKQANGSYVYSYEHAISSNVVVVMDNGAAFKGASVHGTLGGLLLGTMDLSNAGWESFVPVTPEKSFSISFPGSKDATKNPQTYGLAGIDIVICRNIKKIATDFVRRVAGDSTIGGMQIKVKGDKTVGSGLVGGTSTQDIGWIGVPTNFPNTTVCTLMGTGTVIKSITAMGLIENLNLNGTGIQKISPDDPPKDGGSMTAKNMDKIADTAIDIVHTNVWTGWKTIKGVKLGP